MMRYVLALIGYVVARPRWAIFVAGMIVGRLFVASPAFAQFADQRQYAGNTTGTANAQLVAIPNYALNPGVAIRFVASFTNTAALTLNINSTGVVPAQKQTSGGLVPLLGGEVVLNQLSEVVFDGAQFELLNAPAQPPSGEVNQFAMSACPAGWTEMNGSLVSRTTDAALFAAVGTRYGAGDGTTTFALPDGRGYFVRQWADAGSIDGGRVMGSTQALQVGASTGTFSGTSSGTFSGPISATSSSSSSSSSTFSSGTTTESTFAFVGGSAGGGTGTGFTVQTLPVTGTVTTTTTTTTTTTGTAAGTTTGTTTGTTSNASGNTDNRPINIALQQCIKL